MSEVREVALCLLPTGSRDVQFDAEGKLPEGDLTILYEFKVTGKAEPLKGNGTPGVGTLYVNGAKVGSVDMDVTVPFLFSIEGIIIGHDYGDSVDHDKPTFPFTGTIKQGHVRSLRRRHQGCRGDGSSHDVETASVMS